MGDEKIAGLVERLCAKRQSAPVLGGGNAAPNGPMGSYISDDGMRLVNPDGPAAAEALTAQQQRIAELEAELSEAMGALVWLYKGQGRWSDTPSIITKIGTTNGPS